MVKKLEDKKLGWEQLRKNECSPPKYVVMKYCSRGECEECQKEILPAMRNHYGIFFTKYDSGFEQDNLQ